jgi:hypothetical protein
MGWRKDEGMAHLEGAGGKARHKRYLGGKRKGEGYDSCTVYETPKSQEERQGISNA